MSDVTDNTGLRRFELQIGGDTAFADYRIEGETIVITHVECPVALRGGGVAGKLMEGITALIRERGQRLYPVCSYAVAWLNRHPEALDLTTRQV